MGFKDEYGLVWPVRGVHRSSVSLRFDAKNKMYHNLLNLVVRIA